MNSRKRKRILLQCRMATFCLLECWAALGKIECLIQNDRGESCDAIGTFFLTESLYTSRYLYAPDLILFFDGLHELAGLDRKLQQSFSKKTRNEILGQLRKASWAYEQVKCAAKTIALAISRNEDVVLEQIHELAIVADEGCQLSTEDVEVLILGIPDRRCTQDV